jgi:hypothetical protein
MVTRHVHARADEMHTFATQARAMPWEGRNAVHMNDSMKRYVWLVAVPERVTYGSR